MQSPRECVKRTLAFDDPERVPRQLWVLPWAAKHHGEDLARIQRRFPDDIVHCPGYLRETPPFSGDAHEPGLFTDDWGCTFENLQSGVIGEVKNPQLKDWADADAVRVPMERLTLESDKVNEFCRSEDRFVLAGTCPRPFEQLQFIRGTENLLVDLLDRPADLMKLLSRMHDFYCEELEAWARTQVDGLMFMDDWGSQQATLISPALWRELFMPLYRDYIDIAHRHGKAAFMHSDGHILGIFEDLVDLGLDAINSQIFCMGLDDLGTRFAGRITFWGELDRQDILPNASVREVREAAKRMRECFHRNGGLIAQCEFGPSARPENVEAFYEAWSV